VCSSRLLSVWISNGVIVTCTYELCVYKCAINPTATAKPVYSHSIKLWQYVQERKESGNLTTLENMQRSALRENVIDLSSSRYTAWRFLVLFTCPAFTSHFASYRTRTKCFLGFRESNNIHHCFQTHCFLNSNGTIICILYIIRGTIRCIRSAEGYTGANSLPVKASFLAAFHIASSKTPFLTVRYSCPYA
jgi:hypothetical protein